MPVDLLALAGGAARKAQHEMTVCNSCRYCEAYCPVFQAMEERLTFTSGDVAYLANLCHNCGECLYACQYAPPHEFGIDVPKTFSALRVESYEAAAWPAFARHAFRRPWTAVAMAFVVSVIVVGLIGPPEARTFQVLGTANFYSVIPHDVMVTLFGAVGLFAVLALGMGYRRFAVLADLKGPRRTEEGPRRTALSIFRRRRAMR